MSRAAALVGVVSVGLLLASPATAQTQGLPRGADKAPEAVRPWLGAWDVEKVGASRQCTVTLAAEEAAQGRQLRFPATCRRALPVLSEVASWSVTPQGLPRLDDAAGKPVIVFGEAGADAALQGKATDGHSYRLDPKGYPRSARRPAASSAEVAAVAAQRPTAVDPSRAPSPESLPGRYSLMRQANREACRLVLGGESAAGGRFPAAFEGACTDTGLTIFDPAGWRYAAGRLTLVARKGHTTDLVFENGLWRKDPAVGAPLLLRKLP